MRLPGRRPKEDTATPGDRAPADGAAGDRSPANRAAGDRARGDRTRNDSVRGLLAIALGWTVVVTALVAVHPASARDGDETGRTGFTIVSVDGVLPENQPRGIYTVHREPVRIAVEVTGDGDVECWNLDTEDFDHVSGGSGTLTLEVGLQTGRNTIECTTYALLAQSETIEITYAPAPPTSTPTPTEVPGGVRTVEGA